MNTLKVGLALGVAVMLMGCASVSSVSNKMVNNTEKSGIIYGASGIASEQSAQEVCKAIANKDFRCDNADDYLIVTVISKFGFSDGAVGINALVKKNFPNLTRLNFTGRLGDKDEPYVKAKVIPSQLGEIMEIVSTNGDGKCIWSGMPRAGGVVCQSYNYDYRKDFTGVVFR